MILFQFLHKVLGDINWKWETKIINQEINVEAILLAILIFSEFIDPTY